MTETQDKPGRGRKPGFRMSEEHRVKIKNSNILNALVEHVEGNRKMSASQVSAGLGLLRKVLPDLSNVELSNDPDNPITMKWIGPAPMTNEEWSQKYGDGSEG